MPLVERTEHRHGEQRYPVPAPAQAVREQCGHGAEIKEMLDLVKPVRDMIDLPNTLRADQNRNRHQASRDYAKAPEPRTR